MEPERRTASILTNDRGAEVLSVLAVGFSAICCTLLPPEVGALPAFISAAIASCGAAYLCAQRPAPERSRTPGQALLATTAAVAVPVAWPFALLLGVTSAKGASRGWRSLWALLICAALARAAYAAGAGMKIVSIALTIATTTLATKDSP